ncbi:hypothetical protein BRADI_5g27105v3 [Brachypodium distachyon]|uniref:Uncharacterized protein n=1 Tax=Brachypodium distachyon TaxID=15368 RepID=A0A0Q3P926_BRADI|nr:hypothetical protein BRADI_5g27105v3 [Brachypodium distachyon]
MDGYLSEMPTRSDEWVSGTSRCCTSLCNNKQTVTPNSLLEWPSLLEGYLKTASLYQFSCLRFSQVSAAAAAGMVGSKPWQIFPVLLNKS